MWVVSRENQIDNHYFGGPNLHHSKSVAGDRKAKRRRQIEERREQRLDPTPGGRLDRPLIFVARGLPKLRASSNGGTRQHASEQPNPAK